MEFSRRLAGRWVKHVLTGTITWSTWVDWCDVMRSTRCRSWALMTSRLWCGVPRYAFRHDPMAPLRASTSGLWSRCVDTACFFFLNRAHYVEYLAGLARKLDPIPIMDVTELVAELRRRALPLPERGPWDTDPIYAGMCAEVLTVHGANQLASFDVAFSYINRELWRLSYTYFKWEGKHCLLHKT